MIGIDTNVLVRYLTQDDEQQAILASKLIQSYSGKISSIFINNIVFCELIWVLERGYKYDRTKIASAIRNILCTREFAFEQLDILWVALSRFENENSDFSDALIGEVNIRNGYTKTLSFDQKAVKLIAFKIMDETYFKSLK